LSTDCVEEPVAGFGGAGDRVPSRRAKDHGEADEFGIVAGDVDGCVE
jgi:hypothetical protein